jgi:hypothetical protein
MTAEQALELLDRIISQVQLSRADHQKVSEAVEVLKNKITLTDA